jgi:hypothetical protein
VLAFVQIAMSHFRLIVNDTVFKASLFQASIAELATISISSP